MAPNDDGLLGFKWRLPSEDDCNSAVDDCYNPKELDEATGDSISVFADVTEIIFRNDGTGSNVFGRKLEAGFLALAGQYPGRCGSPGAADQSAAQYQDQP